MLEYDLKEAHAMVREQKYLGNDVQWEGWDLVFYRPAQNAVYSNDGVWRRNRYAFANRVVVDSDGKYRIDQRNIRTKRAR